MKPATIIACTRIFTANTSSRCRWRSYSASPKRTSRAASSSSPSSGRARSRAPPWSRCGAAMRRFSPSTIARCAASGAATASTCVTASAPCAAVTVIRSASSFMMPNRAAMQDLFDPVQEEKVALGADAVGLRRFASAIEPEVVGALNGVGALAPFRNMGTPGGYTMSVVMTNCGLAGWVTDLSGYRYTRQDPVSGNPWPPMPAIFLSLAMRAAAVAGFANFLPDACLINRYVPGAKLSLHQDKNETDFTAPIVSVSLGLPAKFLFGGLRRNDRVTRVELGHGDVVVWGPLRGLASRASGSRKAATIRVTARCRLMNPARTIRDIFWAKRRASEAWNRMTSSSPTIGRPDAGFLPPPSE